MKRVTGDQPRRFWAKTKRDRSTGCLLWTACVRPNGQGMLKWRGKCRTAKRVAYELVKGKAPFGDVVQLCGNAACVEFKHFKVGRQRWGAGRTKLSPRDVATLIDEFTNDPDGFSARELATLLGVRPATVRDVVCGRSWRSVGARALALGHASL